MDPDNPNFRTLDDWEKHYEQLVEYNKKLRKENAELKLELKKHCADPEDPTDHCPLCANEKEIEKLKKELDDIKSHAEDRKFD